jgi:hypothetical protein
MRGDHFPMLCLVPWIADLDRPCGICSRRYNDTARQATPDVSRGRLRGGEGAKEERLARGISRETIF